MKYIFLTVLFLCYSANSQSLDVESMITMDAFKLSLKEVNEKFGPRYKFNSTGVIEFNKRNKVFPTARQLRIYCNKDGLLLLVFNFKEKGKKTYLDMLNKKYGKHFYSDLKVIGVSSALYFWETKDGLAVKLDYVEFKDSMRVSIEFSDKFGTFSSSYKFLDDEKIREKLKKNSQEREKEIDPSKDDFTQSYNITENDKKVLHVSYAINTDKGYAYRTENLDPLLKLKAHAKYYKSMSSIVPFPRVEYVFYKYRYQLSSDELFLLLSSLKSTRRENTRLLMISDFLTKSDNRSLEQNVIDVVPPQGSKELNLGDGISFGKNINVSLTPSETNVISVNGNRQYELDIFKYCLGQVAKNYKLGKHDFYIRVSRYEDTILNSLTPLEVYMKLINHGKETNNHYIGDFSPVGALKPWGYMKDQIRRLKDIQQKFVVISKYSYQDLRDMVSYLGVKFLLEKQFIGLKSLKDLKDSETNFKASEWSKDFNSIYQEVTKGKISKSMILKKLGEVIQKQPNHYSAIIFRDYLSGKLRKTLSLKNTYYEYESFYQKFRSYSIGQYYPSVREFRSRNYDQKTIIQDLADNSREIVGLIKKINIFAQVAHPQLKASAKSMGEALKCLDQMNNKMLFDKDKWNKVKRQYFSLLRKINLQRDLFIDNQKVLDEVFK